MMVKPIVPYEHLPLPPPGTTAAVGLSGGVDSAAAALLLLERGCRVIGVTMSHWRGETGSVPAREPGGKHACFGPDEAEDVEECRSFCASLGIPYHVVDVAEDYEKEVLAYFRQEYRNGRTPNPCVKCNGKVKFGSLLSGLEKAGVKYDYFCTGHYASVVRPLEALPNGSRHICLARSSDPTKDQSYFLYPLGFETLEKVRFPLWAMKKSEVKSYAAAKGLSQAARPESQDFAPAECITALFADKEPTAGDFVDERGKVLGKHRGIEHYTVGQRRGLGLSAEKPLYVKRLNAAANQVVLGSEEDLFSQVLAAGNWKWAGGAEPASPFWGTVKIRSNAGAAAAELTRAGAGQWKVTFQEPVRAVAPGQSAVVYLGDVVFGGGIIEG